MSDDEKENIIESNSLLVQSLLTESRKFQEVKNQKGREEGLHLLAQWELISANEPD